jgi:hypothetical protein
MKYPTSDLFGSGIVFDKTKVEFFPSGSVRINSGFFNMYGSPRATSLSNNKP